MDLLLFCNIMVTKKKFNINVLAYEIKLKEKYKKYLQTEDIYALLQRINGLPYDRETHKGKCKLTNDGFDLCMNILPDLNLLDKNEVKIIDFIMDKEVDETYHSKDKKGSYGLAKLEAGKVYCHKTHGKFIFKYKDNSWKLIVLLERRHHNVWLSHIFKYLIKFKSNWKFEYSQLAKKSDLMEKLNSINNSKFILLQDMDIQLANEPSESLSDKTYKNKYKKAFATKDLKLIIKEGGLKNMLKELLREIFHIEKPTLDEKTLKDLSSHVSLKVYGSINNKFKLIDFFSDLVFYNFDLDKDKEGNEIKTTDFFEKLNSIITIEEIDKLFRLV